MGWNPCKSWPEIIAGFPDLNSEIITKYIELLDTFEMYNLCVILVGYLKFPELDWEVCLSLANFHVCGKLKEDASRTTY